MKWLKTLIGLLGTLKLIVLPTLALTVVVFLSKDSLQRWVFRVVKTKSMSLFERVGLNQTISSLMEWLFFGRKTKFSIPKKGGLTSTNSTPSLSLIISPQV